MEKYLHIYTLVVIILQKFFIYFGYSGLSVLIKRNIKRLKVPADTKYLGKIRDFATKYGEKFGFNLRQINGFKLSIDEICTNIIRYAYKNRSTQGTIEITIEKKGLEIITKIIDHGIPFDYSKVDDPDLDTYIKQKRKGGFGIFLVRQLNEKVEYNRINDTNILTLYNRVEPKPTLIELIKKNFNPSKMTIRVRFAIIATIVISIVSVGTFFLAKITQEKTLIREYISKYTTLLKNFSETSSEFLINERTLILEEQLYNIIKNDPTINRITIINKNGTIVADSNVRKIGKIYKNPPGTIPLIDQDYLVQEFTNKMGEKFLYFGVPVRVSEIYIGKIYMSVPKSIMLENINKQLNRNKIFIYMIIFWTLGIIGISFIGNMFITPIKKITEELYRVSKEGIKGGFHFTGYGEFAEISTAFNKMMRALKDSEIKLTDQARLKREMQLAQSIQQTLLPKEIPHTEGFDIAARYQAAMEVGGDYFDFFFVDENSIGIAVGDVSGKGIGGAFVMSIVRTALRLEARGQKNAADVLSNLNITLDGEFKKGMYITLFYVILDSKKRIINYASAGHNPMILYRAKTDRIYRLNPKGFPIGLNLGDPRFFQKNITNEKLALDKDDLLFIYTDGITEAMNPEREEFGEKRLLKAIKKYRELDANSFSDALMEEIKSFTRRAPQSDDITFIVIKEKEGYSEIEYHKRKELFDLIENKHYSIKEACQLVGISTSTYYKLKKLRETGKEAKIIPKDIKRKIEYLDFELSQKIIEIIKRHPEASAKKITSMLASKEYGNIKIESKLVYRELKRLKLSTKEKRLAYVKRINGHKKDKNSSVSSKN